MPCEARFCTTSLAKRSKQQTSQPRSLLIITMLHCKRGTRARFWSGQPRPSVEQPRPYRPRANQRALEKATPLYGGRGGGGKFVDRRVVLSPCIRASASVDFEARLFDIVCLVVCLFGCLFVCLFLSFFVLFVCFVCLCIGLWIVLLLEKARSHFRSSPRNCCIQSVVASAAGAAQLLHGGGIRRRSRRRPVGQLHRPAGAGAGGGGPAMAICGRGISKRRQRPLGGRIAAGDNCRKQCAACAGRVCLSTGCGGGGRRPAVQGGGLATGGARYGGPKPVGEVGRIFCRLAG